MISFPIGAHRFKGGTHLGVEGDKRLEFRWFVCEEVARIDMRPAALQRGLASGQVSRALHSA